MAFLNEQKRLLNIELAENFAGLNSLPYDS